MVTLLFYYTRLDAATTLWTEEVGQMHHARMKGDADAKDGGTTQQGAPHGITLFDHAQIAAEIAEGDRPMTTVLEVHGLTETRWNESTIYWMTRMGNDVRDNAENARMPPIYSDAFAKAQAELKSLPPSDAVSYAKLVVDIQMAGSPAQPLAVRGLSTADYLRLSRHWAQVLSTDSEQSKMFFETYQALWPSD